MPGPRNPWLTPYMIPWSEAVHSGGYKRVVAVTAAQSGKTDSMLDVIGARLDQRPAPIIYVGPTREFLTDQFEPRLMDLLDQAQSLTDKVVRGRRMKKTLKWVAGVRIRLAHGSSSTALKSDPAALALIDEYDEMSRSVQGQGDVLGLVEARGQTYADFTTAVTSTPSRGMIDTEFDPDSGLEFWKEIPKGDGLESPIWALWQEGTRHHWTWPCKHCSKFFVPRFKQLHWPKDATPTQALRDAVVVCPHCGGTHDETDKTWLNTHGAMVSPGQTAALEDGVTVVRGIQRETSTLSFWTSGLASPFVTFGERAETYITAARSGDLIRVQTATNAEFGELWVPGGGSAPEWQEVARLRTAYSLNEIPVGVMILTAGIDVQKNRLVYVVRGWGVRAESWLIDHGELWGATDEAEVWADLSTFLDRKWGEFHIRLAFIDSGFRPNKTEKGAEHAVYEFCRGHQRNCRPTKGHETMAKPVTVAKIEVNFAGRPQKYGLDLVHINSDWAKLWVHERIRWPHDQPGAFHLASDTSEDYCQQLVSEARMSKPNGRVTWVQRSRENHYLDAEAMAYAAGYLLNVQHIQPHHRLRSAPPPPGTPAPEVIERTRRPATRSKYLGR